MHQIPFVRRAFAGAFLFLVSIAALHAQPPYVVSSGQTTTFSYYDPLHSPAPKAPSTPFAPFLESPLPVVSPGDYAFNKASIAPLAQSDFFFPVQIQMSPPVIPRAPTVPPPIVQTPTVSFQGIQQPAPQSQPPSPDIAAGPNDVLMVVNSSLAKFDKSGNLKTSVAFQDFFSALVPTICPTGPTNCQIFDPAIRYDQLHGHFMFLATSRTLDLRTSYHLLSVTNGATYDSGWKTWALNAAIDGNILTANWADFWRVGFDNLGVYLAGNMYNSVSTFQYAKIRVFKKADVYNFAATSLPFQDVVQLRNEDGTLADSITPVHQRGKPSAINSQLLVNSTAIKVPATYLTVWKITDPTVTPLTISRNTIKGLLPYTYPASIAQLNWPATLDSGDTRILKAIYRSGFLYTARDAGYTDVANAATSVTYDVIDTSKMSLASQARLTNTNSFYPAFDVPASTPPGMQFATASVITGTSTGPDGKLTFAGISSLKPGKDFFDLTGGAPYVPNRWGDYFGGAVDPVSGGLWTSGQYADSRVPNINPGFAGRWGTWAGYFPWLTSSSFVDVPAASPFSDYINVLGLWQITSGCDATHFCPGDPVQRYQLGVYIVRSMVGEPCPSNTACATGFTYTAAPYFTDIAANDPIFPYIQKLRDLGITQGCTATTFCPGDPVSRSAAAVFLVRGKMKVLFGDTFTYPATPFFVDVPATSPNFPYVQKMFELGLTSGCDATHFCPDRTLTRQEVAVFVVRAFLN
jgi:hypothetical protein